MFAIIDPCSDLFLFLLLVGIGLKVLADKAKEYPQTSELAGRGIVALLKKWFR